MPAGQYPISGICYDTNGSTVLASVRVSIVNTTNGGSDSVTTNASGEYVYNLANLSTGFSNGDVISLYVSYGRYSKEVLHTVVVATGFYETNLTLDTLLPSVATYASVSEVRRYTKVQSQESNDLALNDLIKAATAWIDENTGRTWKGVQTVSDQYLDGDDTDLLWIPNPDLQSVTSLAIDDDDDGTYTSVASTNYFVYTDKNQVVLKKTAPINKFRAAPQSVKISYTHGNSRPSELVRHLCVLIVANTMHNEPVRTMQIKDMLAQLRWKTIGLA